MASKKHPFQRRVVDWMMETFSMEVCRNTTERNHRFLEESLELVQAMGCTASEAHQLVDYVFGRPVGDPAQEVGGVLVTLAALCSAADLSMRDCGEDELGRCWENIDRIRAKQAEKPKHSPLPTLTDDGAKRLQAGLTHYLRERHLRWLNELLEYYSGQEVDLRKRLDAGEVRSNGYENEWRRYHEEAAAIRAAIEALQPPAADNTCGGTEK
jgi:hypothetical protein